jgi:hypothetical protein
LFQLLANEVSKKGEHLIALDILMAPATLVPGGSAALLGHAALAFRGIRSWVLSTSWCAR